MALDDINPEPTLASAIRCGRAWTRQSLRALARASGVSAAQLSRLEAGAVEQPSLETLLALAQPLNYHPTVLLILGGQLTGERARTELRTLFEKAADQLREQYDDEEYDTLQGRVDEARTDSDLRDLTLYAYTLEVAAVDWPESLSAAMPEKAPDADLLAELYGYWPHLTPDRRWRLLELARDLHTASRARTYDQQGDPRDD